MRKIYGIIGAGKFSVKAVRTALDDLEKDAVFYVPFARSAGMEDVYDWLIDNEREFIVIGNPGKVLREYAAEVRSSDMDDINISVIKYLQDTDATVLVLWEDGIEKAVLKAHAEGHKILELSNGLAPITIEDDPEPVAVPEPDDEEEISSDLSREELEAMPIAAVKRYAVTKDVDIKGLTKGEIIESLFGNLPVEAENRIPELKDEEAPKTIEDLESPVAAIVVIYANGTTTTINADYARLERMVSMLL